MSAKYFRINRAAYKAAELSAITVGRRRWLLPLLLMRLFVLKRLGKVVRVGDPIAHTRLITSLGADEEEEIRKRFAIFQRVEFSLARLEFTPVRYFRSADPRYPYESYSLYSVDQSGSSAVVCTVMSNAPFLVDWIEYYSLQADGRSLRSNNHPLAGALRPPPSAIIRRMPGASPQELYEFHRDELDRTRSLGSHFIEGMSLDQAVEADRDYYGDQIAHWIQTGLLVPD